MNVYELEVQMWEAAKNRDAEAFLEVVDKLPKRYGITYSDAVV